MAKKIRSLKYIKKEIERVEASIRKNARGVKAAAAKKKALNFLGKMKRTLAAECKVNPDNPELSFSAIPAAALTTFRKTTTKKKSKNKKK